MSHCVQHKCGKLRKLLPLIKVTWFEGHAPPTKCKEWLDLHQVCSLVYRHGSNETVPEKIYTRKYQTQTCQPNMHLYTQCVLHIKATQNEMAHKYSAQVNKPDTTDLVANLVASLALSARGSQKAPNEQSESV